MTIIIFDDMSQCTPEEVQRLLPLVSPQRREQAVRFHHTFGQYTSLKSYCLLAQALGYNPVFTYNPHGKPLADDVYFSISHCKAAIAVAVDTQSIGIDVETVHRASPDLIRRTMNSSETEEILRSSDPDRAFTTLWTRKEALFKLLGTGITDELPDILTLHPEITLETHTSHDTNYIWTVAHQ